MGILEGKLKEELISHLVLPQIEFGANQNDWNLWTMVPHLQIKIPVTRARRTHKSLGKVKTDLWVPLGPNVLKTGRVHKWETDKEDVLEEKDPWDRLKSLHLASFYRLWIWKRPKPVVILLTSCVPKTKIDWPAINLKYIIEDIVYKYSI